MAVLLGILSTADMYPEVTTITGLHDELIKVGVMLEEVEPAVEDGLVGMGFTIALFGVRCLGYLDVGSFTKGVLRGSRTSLQSC